MAISLSALACWVINPTGDFRKDDISSASMEQLDETGADRATDFNVRRDTPKCMHSLLQYIISIDYSDFK